MAGRAAAVPCLALRPTSLAGCSELYLPLTPPSDGYGTGLPREQAARLAAGGVQLYICQAAARRQAAAAPAPHLLCIGSVRATLAWYPML